MEILQVSLSVPFIHVKVLIRRIDVFSDERELLLHSETSFGESENSVEVVSGKSDKD